ncbi:MAG TPA: pitrilysin family protein [Azospirillaceae bacterium]|nr:pitrilysin family protein [Azospirillaceae bacterium]
MTRYRPLEVLRRMATVIALAPALLAAPAYAIDIERVVSPGGIEAWLVRDPKTPIIAIEFVFEGGSALDPAGREGTANMMAALLTEGAGELDSTAYQERLADDAISVGFSTDRDAVFGSIRTLAENADSAWDLGRMALLEPRFDASAVERVRGQILAGLRRDLANPGAVAGQVFGRAVFEGHPYGRPPRGTLETVPTVTVEDMQGFRRARLARDNLLVAVSGDIAPEALGPVLDRLFGDLPAKSEPFQMPLAQAKGGGEVVVVQRPTPQSIVNMGQQGIRRSDPDWFPAQIMNYVLGGGSFSSRLMEEIRVKRGLTYGVSSGLSAWDEGALLTAGGSTNNPNAGAFVDLVKAEWQRMAEGGVTDEELADAKTYLTGSFPLQFTTTSSIARVLLQVRRDDLGIDYLARRNALIDAVTREDVARVAKRLLDADQLLTVIVGRPEGVKPTRVIEDWRG